MRNAEVHDEIRKRIRSARRGVSEGTRARWSARICERIAETELFQASKKVAGFLAFDGEADPIGLMTEALKAGKQVYVPMIVGKGEPLMFVPWTDGCKMVKNRFGILEPDVAKSERIEPSELDFVITPLVAFDSVCNRIGVGGGYYDRSFSFLKKPEVSADVSSTCLVGFAFELQRIEAIETNEWDVPLKGVATESCFHIRNEV